jgi:hypothetical protein
MAIKLRATFAWILMVCLGVAVVGMGYSSWLNSQIEEERIRQSTFNTARQILEIQYKLEQNGEMAKQILDIVVRNQAGIRDQLNDVMVTLNQTINEHQIESRKIFIAEFKSLKNDFKYNRDLHRQTQQWLGIIGEKKNK